MPTNTATTQLTSTKQRIAWLVTRATDFIEAHKGEPISHSKHSKELAELLQQCYKLGRQNAQQEILEILDREVIEHIQAQIG